MNISASAIQDIMTLDSLLESSVETLNFDVIHQDESTSSTGLFEALLSSTDGEESVVLDIEAAILGSDIEALSSNAICFDPETAAHLSQIDLGNVDLGSDNLGNLLAANTTLGSSSLYNDPIEYGTPITDAQYWRQQQGAMSCAVVAQISVFQSLTGHYISEDVASVYAQQQGWFDPVTGTPMWDTGNILDALGVSTYEMQNATLHTLEQALAYGNEPIVGLDGNEIWNPLRNWDGSPIEQDNAGHAVWVTGIDYEWNGSIGIIVNDSGTPNGGASVIDYHDFMNAWQDYGYFVSIADNPFV